MKSKFLLFLSVATLQTALFGCGLISVNVPGGEGTTSGEETTTTTDTSTGQASTENLTADWVDFQTENGKLAVKFPGTPQTESQTTPSDLGELQFTMTSYADDANTQFFMVSSVTYPVAPDQYDAAQGLEAAKEGAASNSGSTIVSDEPSDKFGIPGKKLVMNAAQDNGEVYTTRAEIYIDPNGPTLHQILMVTEGDRVDSPEANAFFDSVNITPI
ncbi:hypothetical protein AWQ21_05990 [Picosynechococcus sp. PCC 7003]|uniref:hypothetical protein n=1 Tax=Picosynechococcus sp. PCC 7003 TaxID=374981 RepID=UPI00081043CE|nr:hypothetical protein [Picosynechococcus sp. PCC 7003]ANV83967.1 hypothetical protein AWQ21_05990 [Picosynechococcus sp. PCC 7003]